MSKPEVNIEDVLENAIIETLENMAFVEVIRLDGKSPYDEHMVRLRVEILVNAPFPGEIRLVIPISLAMIFARNMYNLDEKRINDKLIHDVLGELVNIIAGRLMAEILADNETFQLGLPQIGPDAFLDTEASSLAIEFDAEGQPFWAILFGDGFHQ